MSFFDSLMGPKTEDKPAKECCGIVEVPDVRQKDHYSCGAACAMSCGQFFGVGPDTLEEWKTALGTDVEESTHPHAIEKYFRQMGCDVTCDQLPAPSTTWRSAAATTSLFSTIVCAAKTGDREVPEKARFSYGHYIVIHRPHKRWLRLPHRPRSVRG